MTLKSDLESTLKGLVINDVKSISLVVNDLGLVMAIGVMDTTSAKRKVKIKNIQYNFIFNK